MLYLLRVKSSLIGYHFLKPMLKMQMRCQLRGIKCTTSTSYQKEKFKLSCEREPNFINVRWDFCTNKKCHYLEQLQILFGKYCFCHCFLWTVLPFFPSLTVASHPLCWWEVFLRLPTPCALFCLCRLLALCSSPALRWTEAFVSDGLQLPEPLMQALEIFAMFILCILIFHNYWFFYRVKFKDHLKALPELQNGEGWKGLLEII